MEKPGKMEVSAGRRGSGKKIDTWTYRHPEGQKLDIDVYLLSNADGLKFCAKSGHPMLAGLSWEMTDIDALQKCVFDAISDLVDAASSTSWRPAILVETEAVEDHGSRDAFGFRVSLSHLRFDPASSSRNDGKRRVMQEGRVLHVQERALPDALPGDEISGYRVESKKSRALLEGRHQDGLETLRAVIQNFTERLAQRLGPDGLHMGVPSPDELAEMMAQAAAAAKQHPTDQERTTK